jgi:DNA-binding CsgD family transcriptional regulator
LISIFILGGIFRSPSGEIYIWRKSCYKEALMPLQSFLFYIFSLTVVAVACWFALGLVKTFRLHFLSSYVGYLVALNTVGLLNLVVSDLAADLLKGISPLGMQSVYILFGLVALPLIAIAFYFYLAFIAGILDEGISPVSRITYIILWMVILASFLIRIQLDLKQKNYRISQVLGQVMGAIILVIPIAMLIYLMFRTARSSRGEAKKGLMKFAVVSLVCYVLFFAAFSFSQAGSPLRWAVPFFLLVANIAPVLFLRKILSRYCRPILPETFADLRMQRFRDQFQLSTREAEILDLLLKGKSNKDIERELFISPHTVRNHVHNIYQKLSVSSRLQLMNLMRTWFESGA